VSRLTLRLPETLHQQLVRLAENEGISLNQYIVYALTRQAVSAHEIQIVPEVEVEQQKQAFQSLLKQLGQVSPSEIEAVLAAREQVDAEAELNPDAVARLQERIRKRA
jgi:carbamate kinase